MVSRLLSSLDARLARTRDPLQHACLSAERATLLARQGRLDEASAELDRIRARYASKPNALVTAWVCLGEGMVAYFGSFGPNARDRIKRALALSGACQAKSVAALSSAWLAQMDFANLDFEALIQHVAFALQETDADQHAPRARACLVAAEAFHWAERLDLAQPWYGRARQHALAEGDQSMISVLMHNMAWLRVAELRRRDAVGDSSESAYRQAKLGAESIHEFDGMAGISSLDSLVPVLRAQVEILACNFEVALALLLENFDKFLGSNLERLRSALQADIAWCRLRLGDAEGAMLEAQHAVSAVASETHADDRAMTFGRVARIFAELGSVADARSCELQAKAAWHEHRQRQEQLIPRLQEALSNL